MPLGVRGAACGGADFGDDARHDASGRSSRAPGDGRGRPRDPRRGRDRGGRGRRDGSRLLRRRERDERAHVGVPRDRLRRLAGLQPRRLRSRAVGDGRHGRDPSAVRRRDRRLLDRPRFVCRPRTPRGARRALGAAGPAPVEAAGRAGARARAKWSAAPGDARTHARDARRRLLARPRRRPLLQRRTNPASGRGAHAARPGRHARGARGGGRPERLPRIARGGAPPHGRCRLHRRRPAQLQRPLGRSDARRLPRIPRRDAERPVGRPRAPRELSTPRRPHRDRARAHAGRRARVTGHEWRAHDEHGRRRRPRPRVRPDALARCRRRRLAAGIRRAAEQPARRVRHRVRRAQVRATTSRAEWRRASRSTPRAWRWQSARRERRGCEPRSRPSSRACSWRGYEPEDAVARPRLHPTPDLIDAEPGVDEDALAELEAAGRTIRRWERIHHYFGGVSCVGRTGAAGDPRRSGAAHVFT